MPESSQWLERSTHAPPPQFNSRSQDGYRVVHLPVIHCGATRFPEVVFPAKARIALRLLVKIPEGLRRHEFELFARQLYEGEEVGG